MERSLDRSLEDVIDALKHSRNTRGRGCSLLMYPFTSPLTP